MEGQGGVRAVGAGRKGRGGSKIVTVKDLQKQVLVLLTFLLVAFLAYSPFGTRWINNPVGAYGGAYGWDVNRTSASWDTDGWDWDFIDCIYFACVTMTTVGYGDMPTLRQEMRAFTLLFGFIGVTVIGGSITTIADWFSEKARKKFIAKQRKLLGEAHKVAELVRTMDEAEKGQQGPGDHADGRIPTPMRSPPPLPPKLPNVNGQRSPRRKLALQILKALRQTGVCEPPPPPAPPPSPPLPAPSSQLKAPSSQLKAPSSQLKAPSSQLPALLLLLPLALPSLLQALSP